MAIDNYPVLFDDVTNELRNYRFTSGYDSKNAIIGAKILFSKNNWFRDCTELSRRKSVYDMLIQELNPLKNQCYFIPYKSDGVKELKLVLDYSGAILVAKNVDKSIRSIRYKVVKEGDLFDFEIEKGLFVIKRHKPTKESLSSEAYDFAYALSVDENEKILDLDIINYEQYFKSVKKLNKFIKGEPVCRQDGTFHPKSNNYKYPEIMFAKTVVHKLCRRIVKTSPNLTIIEANSRTMDENDIADDSIVINEPDTIQLDFDNEQINGNEPDDIPDISQENMATFQHAEKIFELAETIGINENLSNEMSKFVGRTVEKVRFLTEKEADSYIVHLTNTLSSEIEKEEKEDNVAWGVK